MGFVVLLGERSLVGERSVVGEIHWEERTPETPKAAPRAAFAKSCVRASQWAAG